MYKKSNVQQRLVTFTFKDVVKCLCFLKYSQTIITLITQNSIILYDIIQAQVFAQKKLNQNTYPIWCKNITFNNGQKENIEQGKSKSQYLFLQGKMGVISIWKIFNTQILLLQEQNIFQFGFTKLTFHQQQYDQQGKFQLKYSNNMEFFTIHQDKHELILWSIQINHINQFKNKLLSHKKSYKYDSDVKINLNAIKSFNQNDKKYVILGNQGFQIFLFQIKNNEHIQDEELQPFVLKIPSQKKQNLIIYSIELLDNFSFIVSLRNDSIAIVKINQSNMKLSYVRKIQNQSNCRYISPFYNQADKISLIFNSKYSLYKITNNENKNNIQQQQDKINMQKYKVESLCQIVPQKLLKSSIGAKEGIISDFCVKRVEKTILIIGCTQNKKIFSIQIDFI